MMSQIDEVRQMDGTLSYLCPNMTAAEIATLKAEVARVCGSRHSPGDGVVSAADDGETKSGPAEGAAAAAAGVSGHHQKLAQTGQQATRRLRRAQVEQQVRHVVD